MEGRRKQRKLRAVRTGRRRDRQTDGDTDTHVHTAEGAAL